MIDLGGLIFTHLVLAMFLEHVLNMVRSVCLTVADSMEGLLSVEVKMAVGVLITMFTVHVALFTTVECLSMRFVHRLLNNEFHGLMIVNDTIFGVLSHHVCVLVNLSMLIGCLFFRDSHFAMILKPRMVMIKLVRSHVVIKRTLVRVRIWVVKGMKNSVLMEMYGFYIMLVIILVV